MLRAVGCLFLIASVWAEVEVPGATRAEWYEALRGHVARKGGVDRDAVICRLVAAALCQKASPGGEGARVSDKMAGRPWMIWKDFEPVHDAAQAVELPAEFRRQFLAWHGGLFLYPIRQSPPAIGTRRLVAILEDLPPESELLEIGAGTTVAELIAARWRGWAEATPVQRMLVYEALARANPLILDRGSYRVDADHPAAAGVRRTMVPTWLEIVQMQHSLYAIDPDLHPMHPRGFDPEADNGEEFPVPIGNGQVWVRRFLVPVGGRILMPPEGWLAAAASPETVELRNAMIADAGVLAGLDPVSLDLAGNHIADLEPLTGMRRLAHLRLDRNPVADLAPLAALPLESLELVGTRVADLGPLAGHPELISLRLDHAPVTDLAPLADLPLREIGLDGPRSSTSRRCAGRSSIT